MFGVNDEDGDRFWSAGAIDEYIEQYRGYTRFERLLMLAKCSSTKVSKLALTRFVKEMKDTDAPGAFLALKEAFPDNVIVRERETLDWFDVATKREKERLSVLEADLVNARKGASKEVTHTALNKLGDFYFGKGEYASSLRMFSWMRDYCATDDHQLECSLKILKATLKSESDTNLELNIQRMQNALGEEGKLDNAHCSLLEASRGLVSLVFKNYTAAAGQFCKVLVDIGSQLNDVVSGEDIAFYGGITALATYPRDRLKDEVLLNPNFAGLLDRVPAMRSSISAFLSSRYSDLFHCLKLLYQRACADKFFLETNKDLYAKIRQRAILQYFQPYKTVDLHQMAENLCMTHEDLENDIIDCIESEALQNVRIDRESNFLVHVEKNLEDMSIENAIDTIDQLFSSVQITVLSLSMKRKFYPSSRIPESESDTFIAEEEEFSCAYTGDSAMVGNASQKMAIDKDDKKRERVL